MLSKFCSQSHQSRGELSEAPGEVFPVDSWWWDSRLDEARVQLETALRALKQCEEWTAELEAMWARLQG